MHCHCYLRNGIVYIPTQGEIHKGLYLDVEPVAVVPLSDRAALHRAFAETIARGNPNVPLPKQSEIPPPLLPKYAGVKAWSTFARNASTRTDAVFDHHSRSGILLKFLYNESRKEIISAAGGEPPAGRPEPVTSRQAS